MQLLDSEQLEYAFQIHGISLEGEARKFYSDVWSLIQRAEKIRDPLELSNCERELRRLCRDYFSLMRGWRQEEEDRHDLDKSCQTSRENAHEAGSILPVFEKQFYRYALCYLELNRELIQVRAKLSYLARDYNLDDASKMMEVNNATGSLLVRAHRERKLVMQKRLRLERVRELLRLSDPLIEQLGADLPRLLGQGAGDHQLTLFKGAMRQYQFDKAKEIVRVWPHEGLVQTGNKMIGYVQQNVLELKAQDGLMLHSGELSLINALLKNDESKINRFLEKFNIPYMVFQYRNLIHQGYMLGHIGSIEGLIVTHAKLVSMSARPHNDADQARVQEQAILVPARALMQMKFQNLGAIFNDMETTSAILEKLFAETREYMANAPA